MTVLGVAIDTPQHAGIDSVLDYESERTLSVGTLVRVPLGKRSLIGIVWREGAGDAPEQGVHTLRPVVEVLDALPPLSRHWCALVTFAATYYRRSIGELALSALPAELRKLDAARLAQRLRRWLKRLAGAAGAAGTPGAPERPPLTGTQQQVLDELRACIAETPAGRAPPPFLLHGVTGSGKTEVYLQLAEEALAAGRQALLLVPEINLTPQLEARVRERFPGRRVVALHSGLTVAARLGHWLAAACGEADLVLGTRLAVFAPLDRLGIVIVDEEHDPSYKQQEGARYSARDLAVWRAHDLGIPVLLGSATPSLESWRHAKEGRYRYLRMPERVGQGRLPPVRIVDMAAIAARLDRAERARLVFAPALVEALKERLARGEQSLLLLNRRGYAPVLHCADCGWKSGCPHCSAWQVFHKRDRMLRCHHCGLAVPVPRACPECGNLDIQPIGRGTEKLEELVAAVLPGARIARIDADSTRGAGALEAQLAAVHAGDVDVLVGTQMVTKGHDFRRITLVAAVSPDAALFASDFRAPERLFALLMQAAGRAGRDAAAAGRSEMWLQTWSPRHPLFGALQRHDYAAFADGQLQERRSAGLPPYAHLALLRAEARDAEAAEAFLRAARDAARALPEAHGVAFYAPVPPPVARVAGFERRQMLLESGHRGALQRLLAAWTPALPALRASHRKVVRWAVDVDPLAI